MIKDQEVHNLTFKSNVINLEFVNVTEAYSSMCGGIEIRHATRGLIKYQTSEIER